MPDIVKDVPLTKEGVATYLDTLIKKYRNVRDTAPMQFERMQAQYYVDAYQSVRATLLGEPLK